MATAQEISQIKTIHNNLKNDLEQRNTTVFNCTLYSGKLGITYRHYSCKLTWTTKYVSNRVLNYRKTPTTTRLQLPTDQTPDANIKKNVNNNNTDEEPTSKTNIKQIDHPGNNTNFVEIGNQKITMPINVD